MFEMALYDYRSKIKEFLREVRRVIKLKLEFGIEQEYERILFLLHRMIFYAEQFFIEQLMKYRNEPERIEFIEQERRNVLQNLRSFVEAIKNADFTDLYEIESFLDEWDVKLSQDSIYS